ncbi:MAG: thermonuclease family protein [Calditrichia bacterium]
MTDNLYYYKAEVVSVYDGDTITVDIDLGFRAWLKKEKIRLYRINAPEVRGSEREEGLKSRDFLRSQILDKEIVLQTIRDRQGKYGRYLAEVWLEQGTKWININDLMVTQGMAHYQDY